MQIKSNGLLKYAVPTVLLIVGVLALRSCYQSDSKSSTGRSTAQTHKATRPLTPAETKALGLDADTPRDTVATLVARMQQMQQQLSNSQQESAALRQQNQRLADKNQHVDSRINSALSQQKKIDSQQRSSMMSSIGGKLSQLRSALNLQSNKSSQSDDKMPVGLGLNGETPSGAQGDNVTWVRPLEARPTGAQASQTQNTGTGSNSGSAFNTAFASGSQDVAAAGSTARRTLTGHGESNATEPVYTVPENATLTGSVAMSALLGRVPIDGTVQDPYPFKIVIGPGNLTANGIELPELKGAIVSGTATGDWTLSCVRGTVRSITFVFQDGTTRVVPESKDPDESNQSKNNQRDIGYISNPAGIPCVPGTRKTNARSFILTDLLLSAGAGAANAVAGSQTTTSVNGLGATTGLTGNTGKYIAAQAGAQGINEVRQWIQKRFGQTFDAVYVPPGQSVVVNVDKTLDIDYDPEGRRVHHVRINRSNSLD